MVRTTNLQERKEQAPSISDSKPKTIQGQYCPPGGTNAIVCRQYRSYRSDVETIDLHRGLLDSSSNGVCKVIAGSKRKWYGQGGVCEASFQVLDLRRFELASRPSGHKHPSDVSSTRLPRFWLISVQGDGGPSRCLDAYFIIQFLQTQARIADETKESDGIWTALVEDYMDKSQTASRLLSNNTKVVSVWVYSLSRLLANYLYILLYIWHSKVNTHFLRGPARQAVSRIQCLLRVNTGA